ncbi:hypothetical protein Tco_1227682 [Tanacetum coccineum]
MSDSEDSTVTYTEISSPYEDLSDIGSPGAEGPIFQDPPSPDYVPGPEEPEQAPPSPIYVPFVPEPVYPEFLPEVDLRRHPEEVHRRILRRIQPTILLTEETTGMMRSHLTDTMNEDDDDAGGSRAMGLSACRTTPGLDYEVGESSELRAARQRRRPEYLVGALGTVGWMIAIRYIRGHNTWTTDIRVSSQSRIVELQAADRRRQTMILDLLKADHRRQRQLVGALKIVKSLKTQMIELRDTAGT